jgi:hypothetical protein
MTAFSADFHEYELPQLDAFEGDGAVRFFRGNTVQILTTPIIEFDAVIFNIFAPFKYVFRDFSKYAALSKSEINFYWPMYAQGKAAQTEEKLGKILRKSKIKKHSKVAYMMLSGLTNSPYHRPKTPDADYYLSFGPRHMVLVAPIEATSSISAHFVQQLERFGENAFREYPENMTPGDHDGLSARQELLLGRGSIRLSSKELTMIDEEIRHFSSSANFSTFVETLDPRVGIRGLINFMLMTTKYAPFMDMEAFERLLRFRVRVAVAVCDLPTVERKRNDILGLASTDGYVPSEYLQNDGIEMFNERLEPYKNLIEFGLAT